MSQVAAGDVVRRLLDAGLIRTADVVDGDVVVRNTSRSNAVYVVSAGEREYVVKGPSLNGSEDEGRLGRERRFYTRVATGQALRAAAPVPEPVEWLDDLLVLRRTQPGETLEERYRRRGPSAGDVRMLGFALGSWRQISSRFSDLEVPAQLPWVLEALEPSPPDVVSQSPGASKLARALREELALTEGLERLRGEWRRDAVIHGDVRWDNAIVEEDPSTGCERVVLVDWEFLDAGDAGWDVAGALADAVALEAVPTDAPPPGGDYRRASQEALERISSAMAGPFDAFASAYRAVAPSGSADADIEAGLRLLPARVLQIAFLHAAWGFSGDLGSALQLAGVAAGLLDGSRRPAGEQPR